jgi:hypothetical protein
MRCSCIPADPTGCEIVGTVPDVALTQLDTSGNAVKLDQIEDHRDEKDTAEGAAANAHRTQEGRIE